MTDRKTRSPQTEQLYFQRANALISQAEKELGLVEGITPDQFVVWLADKMPSITYNTFRQYKAAVAYYFGTFSDPIYQNASKAVLELSQTDRIARSQGKSNSRAARSIRESDFMQLKQAAELSTGQWAKRAMLLFEATIIAGLRPTEWEHIYFDPQGRGIVVQNAKASNGRSSGKHRAIPIDDPADMEILRENVQKFRAWMEIKGEPFSKYHLACANAFNELVKQVFKGKKHYRIYTARHQFSANMKNIYSREEVASLMGHGSEETAERHYGKRKSGWAKFKEKAKQERLANKESPAAHVSKAT